MRQQSQTIFRLFKILYERFLEDGCSYRAAALTYTTLLSLVPLMAVSFAIFSAFPVFQSLQTQIQNFIFLHFMADSGQLIQTYLQKFVSQTKNLSAIGSVFLVVTSVLMMFTMEQAFNVIWKVKPRSKGVSTFMTYWAVLTLSPILIGLSMVLSAYITSLPFVSATVQHLELLSILPFVINVAFFTLIYVVVPNCHVPIKYGFIGGFITSVFFGVAKKGFSFYVTHFPSYTLLYGALATIPIFLVWLYLTWVIILFGAIISNALYTGYRYRFSVKIDGYTHAYRWLGHFWKAMQEGKSLSLTDLIYLDSCDYLVEPTIQLELMLTAGLIQRSISGHYVLSQDLSQFTLRDLLGRLPWRLPVKDEIAQWEGSWEKNLAGVLFSIEEKTKGELDIPLKELYQKI